jgi:hypothetical protein
MIINCNDIDLDFIPHTNFSLNKLKSGKLVKEIRKISESFSPKRNFMVMSMSIFNLLEQHDKFEHKSLNIKIDEVYGLYLVGRIFEIDCYIDLSMVDNNILLSWDKQRSREIKLDSLLNNNYKDLEDLKIDIII